jgi:general secretion pathway protein L
MAITDAFRFFRAQGIPGRIAVGELLELWRDALLLCLPPALRDLLARRDQRLIVIPNGANASLYQQQGDARQPIGELGGEIGSLSTLLAGTKEGRRRAVIELPAGQVLVRNVSFPAQVRDNLAQVMRYEIDRVSPFRADQVFFDFRVREGATSRDKLLVELVLCRRDRVSGWIQYLREAGVPAKQVTWDGAWNRANLLPTDERPSRRQGLFSVSRLLFLAALVLSAAVLSTPLWQKNRILDERNAELREAKVEAEKVQEVRGALDRAREGSVAVLQRKLEQPRTIDLLRELTVVLPDDTWVQNLDVREGEVQIRGESAQATALIGLLEKAPGVSDVAFRSPVVAATGQERFHISFTYAREEDK